ncbi:unnamed protein product [Echinostoma caproni]|uniref:Saposin B-type domain-containing protein n=1 Tax=Echinostoma caproni TaxID=27848 RepID=A0A183AFW3_9TREM|nr:unnamed protein product [Echinostoma caproni]
MENTDYCQLCTLTMDQLKEWIQKPSMKTLYEKAVDAACKHTGAMYSMCKETIMYGIQVAIEFVEKEDSTAACRSGSKHSVVKEFAMD